MILFKKKWYTSIEEAEKNPKRVKYLRLWNVDISLYEGRFSQFTSLKNLDISWSPASIIPSDIASLKKLHVLRVLNVPLNEFPEWICSLSELRELTIRGTDIPAIPSYINRLHHLKKIEIGNNNLCSLPMEIGELENLKELYASDNKLSSVPEEFRALGKLKRLGLVGNYFSENEANRIRQFFPGVADIWGRKECEGK